MTNRTNGNWLSGNREQLANDQLTSTKPSLEKVDMLADELCSEYDNLGFRKWYCKVINDFGIERVVAWQENSRSGSTPAKLFSYYVKQAREEATIEETVNKESQVKQDEVYEPTDYDLTDEGIKLGLDEAWDKMERNETSSEPKAIPWLKDED